MKKLLSLLIAACLCFSFAGCVVPNQSKEPEAIVWFTLSDIKAAADGVEKVYYNQVALGHVSKEKQAQIDAKIVKIHKAFTVAVRAAKSNPSTTDTESLQKLADDLVVTINALTK